MKTESLVLIAFLSLALTACGSKQTNQPSNQTSQASTNKVESVEAPKEKSSKSKIIPANEKYSSEDLELTVHNYKFVDRIQPENPGDLYNYFDLEDSENHKFILIDATIKNLFGDTVTIKDFAQQVLINSKYKYDLQPTYETDGMLEQLPTINPLEEKEVWFFAEIPNEAINNIQDIKLQFGYNALEDGNNMFDTFESRTNKVEFELIPAQ